MKCTKVKDDEGQTNRYAKGRNSKNPKGKSKTSAENSQAVCLGTQSDSKDMDGDVMMYRKSSTNCYICKKNFADDDATLNCLLPGCDAESHIICLSKRFLKMEEKSGLFHSKSQLIPVQGTCPKCDGEILWGDLIRYKRGCYRKELAFNEEEIVSDRNNGHWADLLSQREIL